jgi:NAD-dependent SIR2 family protein deacetylase
MAVGEQSQSLTEAESSAILRVFESEKLVVEAELETTRADSSPAPLTSALSNLFTVAQEGSDLEDIAQDVRDQLSRGLSTGDLIRLLEPLRKYAPAGLKNSSPVDAWNEKVLTRIGEIPREALSHTTFLLGAGASVASNIPTIEGLLDAIWDRASRSDAGTPLLGLQQWCKSNNVRNVETLMTALELASMLVTDPIQLGIVDNVMYGSEKVGDLGEKLEETLKRELSHYVPSGSVRRITELIKSSSRTGRLRESLAVTTVRETLDTFFDFLVGTMLNAEPSAFHDKVAEFISSASSTKSALITTNYDPCIEIALALKNIRLNYCVGDTRGAESSTRIIKPHGSINWFYCENCQRLRMPELSLIRSASLGEMPYPTQGICNCGGRVKRMIIPPSLLKVQPFPPIVQLINETRIILEQTSTLVVVGYSFSDKADYLVRTILRRLATSLISPMRIVMVNPSPAVVQRVRELIKRNVREYDDKKFYLPVVGKAEDLGIRALDRLNSARSGNRVHARASKPGLLRPAVGSPVGSAHTMARGRAGPRS